MSRLQFNKKKIEKTIQKPFPDSYIDKYEQFSKGLVSPTFKVEIINPQRVLVVKLSNLKNSNSISLNNKILNYLNNHGIPAPKIYFEGKLDRKYITLMECSSGKVASSFYNKSSQTLKKEILYNSGRNLRKIHKLQIPSFWIHQQHEIKNKKEWKNWTKQRIQKYLKFFRNKLDNIDFIEKELNEFYAVLKTETIDFVPLHWDYHLSNINVDLKGKVTGIFDFDNAMKGHSLADLGQTAYWIRFETQEKENFKHFLKGYKNKFSKKELKLIKGYCLLHVLAVSRTIWFRQKRLSWIIERHKQILDELRNGKIIIS